jgi:flagellar motor protein MotB
MRRQSVQSFLFPGLVCSCAFFAWSCAAPKPPPPKPPLPPEVERLNRIEHDVERVKAIAELDRSNEEKKGTITDLESKLAALQAKLGTAVKDDNAPAPGSPKSEERTVERASGNRVRVRLSGELVFARGSARITPEGLQVLADVAKILKETPVKRIDVAGHTDSTPTVKGWEDNWQLSAERARRVMGYLQKQGVDGKHLTFSAWADTDPVDPAGTEDANRKNRRVEIFIEPAE